MQAGDYAAAAKIYAELARERPKDAGLLMNLGMAHYMGGQGPLHRTAAARPAPSPLAPAASSSAIHLEVGV